MICQSSFDHLNITIQPSSNSSCPNFFCQLQRIFLVYKMNQTLRFSFLNIFAYLLVQNDMMNSLTNIYSASCSRENWLFVWSAVVFVIRYFHLRTSLSQCIFIMINRIFLQLRQKTNWCVLDNWGFCLYWCVLTSSQKGTFTPCANFSSRW